MKKNRWAPLIWTLGIGSFTITSTAFGVAKIRDSDHETIRLDDPVKFDDEDWAEEDRELTIDEIIDRIEARVCKRLDWEDYLKTPMPKTDEELEKEKEWDNEPLWEEELEE